MDNQTRQMIDYHTATLIQLNEEVLTIMEKPTYQHREVLGQLHEEVLAVHEAIESLNWSNQKMLDNMPETIDQLEEVLSNLDELSDLIDSSEENSDQA